MNTQRLSITLSLLLSLTLLNPVAQADDGHNHDHDAVSHQDNGTSPKRLPDGSVFLPKPAQRQIAIRTLPVSHARLPRTIELAGKVIIDPNTGGRVQSLLAGRLEAGPNGFPHLGQQVRKGEVLAYVIPANSMIERANQSAQLAELRAAKNLAEKRLARLQRLTDTIPRKEIEAVESERDSLNERIAALSTGLHGRDTLLAPVSGQIASSNAVAGQVVDARELIFEIIDPAQARIEALAYDADTAADIASAALAVGSDSIPLEFKGAAHSLREQALPLLFHGNTPAMSRLAIGQPVTVFAQTHSTVEGFRIPVSALMKNAANQPIVWVKTAPEHFTPHTVTVAPLDGSSVAILSGLKNGDRIVSQAAALLNQIR